MSPRPVGRPTLSLDVARVAEVVTEARLEGLSVVSTVAEVFDVGANRASREIRRAREAGILEPEGHLPTRAVINRMTSRERSWMVCEKDLEPWPCSYIREASPPGGHA